MQNIHWKVDMDSLNQLKYSTDLNKSGMYPARDNDSIIIMCNSYYHLFKLKMYFRREGFIPCSKYLEGFECYKLKVY